MAVPFELIIFGMGILMIIVGHITKKLNIFKLMGSILLIVLSVVILSNGVQGIDNLSTLAIASVCFAIGFVSLITDNFSEEKEKKEEEVEDFEDDGRFNQ